MPLPSTTFRWSYAAVITLLVTALVAGCSSSQPRARAADPSNFEPWSASHAVLFNDSIDPVAVGIGERSNADRAMLLRKRIKSAEFIVRTKIETVTIEGPKPEARYNLSLTVVGDPVVGPAPPGALTIVILPKSPSYGIARALDLRMTGRTFIALLKRFSTENGVELHWYLTEDTPEVLKLIHDAHILSELSNR